MSGEVKKLTKRQAAIIGAFTGVLAGNFEDLAAYASKKLGRSLWTHEFGSEGVAAEIKEAAREDFKAILPEGTRGRS